MRVRGAKKSDAKKKIGDRRKEIGDRPRFSVLVK